MDRRLLLGRVRISIRRSAVACERVGGRSASFISSIASPQSRGFRGLTLGRNAVSGLRRWVAATVRHRCVHLRSADSIARPLRRDAVRHRGRVAAATSEAAAAATAAAVSSAGAVVRRLVDSNGSAVKPKTQMRMGFRGSRDRPQLSQQGNTKQGAHTRRCSWRRWHSGHLLPGCSAQSQSRGCDQCLDP